MEDCKVRKLVYETVKSRGCKLKAIEINGDEGLGRTIIWWGITEEALVLVAYVRANPSLGYFKGVCSDCVSESLDYWVDHGEF